MKCPQCGTLSVTQEDIESHMDQPNIRLMRKALETDPTVIGASMIILSKRCFRCAEPGQVIEFGVWSLATKNHGVTA